MNDLTDRQTQIIKESINLISKQGIQGLTIKNLSKKIGITEPAIYRHFESKMEILVTILDSFKHKNSLNLKKIAAENIPAIQKIEAIYFHHFKVFIDNPALPAVIFSEEIFKNDTQLSEKVTSIMSTTQKILGEILKNGQINNEIRDDIPINYLKFIIMGALRRFISQWRITDYSFNLEEEGGALWESVKKLISKG